MSNTQIFGLCVAALVGAWVVADATRRGKKGGESFLWGLGVFLLMIVFLPIYLYTRSEQISSPSRTSTLCRYCGLYNEGDPFYCNYCDKQLKGVGEPVSSNNP